MTMSGEQEFWKLQHSYKTQIFIIIFFVLNLFEPSSALNDADFNEGQCTSVLGDHIPAGHTPAVPQSIPSPYTVMASASTYAPGSNVAITVTVTGDVDFRGVFITVRDDLGSLVESGSFDVSGDALLRTNCDARAVTHVSSVGKRSVSATWTPPAVGVGRIYFRATVVQTLSVFWIDVRSQTITDDSGNTPPPRVTVAPGENDNFEVDASLCGVDQHCFRTPAGCAANECDAIATWRLTASGDPEDGVLFQMETSDAWMALGLSSDAQMGSDYVLACVPTPAGVANMTSLYTTGRTSPSAYDNNQAGLSDLLGKVENGRISCQGVRILSQDSLQDFMDLAQPNRLFLASGTGGAALGFVSRHDAIPLISDGEFVLTDAETFVDIGSSVEDLEIKIHATFMITAWMLLISISLLLARFYKPAFPGKEILGKQIWFQLHRAVNILAVLLTIVAFIIIFVEVEGYTEVSSAEPRYLKAHPPLGIIVTALAIINPIMALVRPHPDEPRRPLFNFFHWGVGTIAHITSIVTIFFGFHMPKSRSFIEQADRYWVVYVLAGFCGFHALIYFILEILQGLRQRRERSELSKREMEMTNIGQDPKATPQAIKTPTFAPQYVLLVVYLVGAVGAYAAIIVGIATGERDV